MLNPRMIADKTFEGLMEEIYGKIPIYTGEWTNFNPSDPGITVLENFSAFEILQQNELNKVPQSVRASLLELLGYTPEKSACADVLIEPQGLTEDIVIPADQRFYVGNISFETTLSRTMTASHIVGVYAQDGSGVRDLSFLRDQDMARPALPFGTACEEGAALYLVLDKPLLPGESGCIYINVKEDGRRTPFGDAAEPVFASLRFEAYCEGGFVEMEAEDRTHAFLTSGVLHIRQPMEEAVRCGDDEGISGYVWRIVLQESSYDLRPQLLHISGFLFPARQKETLAIAHSFQKASDVQLKSVMLEEGYVRVFVREEKGGSYYVYEECPAGETAHGRFYERVREAYGMHRFVFDRERFGCAPGRVRDAVRIVLYNEAMMRQFYLGEIYGYDRQEFRLPVAHVVTDTFALIAERTDGEGASVFDFVKPGHGGDGKLSYYLYENEGKIRILDAGDYIGAKLYLASVAVSLGEEGNVRAGNRFLPHGYEEDGLLFTNPAPGVGGRFQESVDEVRRRFLKELYEPQAAVLASDYEALVKRIPGLCIARVHAWMDSDKNEVMVTLLPATGERFPQISGQYKSRIGAYLDARRMLATRVTLVQPVYTEVLVRGTVYVKPHYEGCRKQIEAAAAQEIDSVTGSGGFGKPLRFDRVFGAIEALDCVSYVYDLSIAPGNRRVAAMEGADIRPAQHCLFCPGAMKLEIVVQTRKA